MRRNLVHLYTHPEGVRQYHNRSSLDHDSSVFDSRRCCMHMMWCSHTETRVCFLPEEPVGWWTVCVNWTEVLENRVQLHIWERLLDNLSPASWSMIKDRRVFVVKRLCLTGANLYLSLAWTRSVCEALRSSHTAETCSSETHTWIGSVKPLRASTHSEASTQTDSNGTSQTSNATYTRGHQVTFHPNGNDILHKIKHILYEDKELI